MGFDHVAQAGLELLTLGNLLVSVSQSARITGMSHQTWPDTQLIFVFSAETGFHHVGQAGLELLTSGDLPDSTSQSAGITDVSHHTQIVSAFYHQRGWILSKAFFASTEVMMWFSPFIGLMYITLIDFFLFF